MRICQNLGAFHFHTVTLQNCLWCPLDFINKSYFPMRSSRIWNFVFINSNLAIMTRLNCRLDQLKEMCIFTENHPFLQLCSITTAYAPTDNHYWEIFRVLRLFIQILFNIRSFTWLDESRSLYGNFQWLSGCNK